MVKNTLSFMDCNLIMSNTPADRWDFRKEDFIYDSYAIF